MTSQLHKINCAKYQINVGTSKVCYATSSKFLTKRYTSKQSKTVRMHGLSSYIFALLRSLHKYSKDESDFTKAEDRALKGMSVRIPHQFEVLIISF